MTEPTDAQELAEQWVSALVDGELDDDACRLALDSLGDNTDSVLQQWHDYHALGDILRTGAPGVRRLDTRFLDQLRPHLGPPPAALPKPAPHPNSALALHVYRENTPITPATPYRPPQSANDAHWRWLVGALASVALVSLLTWQLWPQAAPAPVLADAAASLAPALVVASGTSASAPVMIRDAQLDALLAAHRQFGGASALHAPAGFLRNTTFGEGAR